MRINVVLYVCGIIIAGFGLIMTIPGFVDVFCGNMKEAFNTFDGSLLSMVVGTLLFLTFNGGFDRITKGEMFLITSLVWVIASAFSAIPFYLNVEEFDYISAYFEAISALTTSGVTAVSTVDNMSQGILMWRSLLQWIGGVGIIVMAIAVLPMLRVGGMQLFYMESSEKMAKAAPSTATVIYRIFAVYAFFTVVFILLLWAAEMNFFDAVNYSFSAIATGGGNITHDQSVGVFSNPLTFLLLAAEMILGSLPLMFLFYALTGNRREMAMDTQARYYLILLFVVWGLVSIYMWLQTDGSLAGIMADTAFYVVSFSSTAGMLKDDYFSLGSFAVAFFILLTLIGGCTGSTSGGIKIFRLQVIIAAMKKYLNNMLSPHQVIVEKYNGKKIDADVITGIFVFFAAMIFTVMVLTIVMVSLGTNPLTAFLSVLTCVANNGIGFGEAMGPYGSFGPFSPGNKLVLALAMLLGRLEFLTAFVLLLPSTWRKR